MSEETRPIVLTRRTESLRQEAAEALLWLVEHCDLKIAGGCLEISGVGGWTPPIGERERYETLIARKKQNEQ